MAAIEHTHPHLPHLDSSLSHHHHHHKTLTERADPQEAINDAESVPSSRSSSSGDDEPTNDISTDTNADGDATLITPNTSIAYDIQLKILHPDPVGDSHNLPPEELPSHWVPTMVSQVARATSTAFGQLSSAPSTPRHSTSDDRQNEVQSKPEKEEQHLLSRLTFENPWEKSFRKPGIKEILSGGLKWGLPDSYTEGSGKGKVRSSGIKSHEKIRRHMEAAGQEDKELGDGWDKIEIMTPDWGWPQAELKKEVDHIRAEETAEHPDHTVQKQGGGEPDYKTQEKPLQEWKDPKKHSRSAVRVTWLGHASTLLQLPPLSSSAGGGAGKEDVRSRSINILFDPIFSERCSPSQSAGPQRFTPAPCAVDDLPPVDFVIISHSHYDHLDYHTMKHLRHIRGDKIHAFVPLGVKEKLVGFGGFGWKKEQVTELDWWDEALLTLPSSGGGEEGGKLRVICTPAQHGSGRGAADKDASLWASWVIEWTTSFHRFATFFAGDTGLKYHHDNPNKRHKYPPCPAFADIAARFKPFDLLLLPISVGSSLSYFRSWDPFPRAISPFPRVSSVLTSSIHMDPYDAVECHRIFEREKGEGGKRMVSLAVHYGTFVRNEEQTKGDVRELRKACRKDGLKFARVRDEACLLKGDDDEEGGEDEEEREKSEEDVFLVADQGKTVWLPIHSFSQSS